MDNLLSTAADSLDTLSAAILGTAPAASTYSDLWGGWNVPPITSAELAAGPSRLALQIRMLNEKTLPEDSIALLSQIPARVQWMVGNTIPNIPGGSAHMGVAVINDFCLVIQGVLPAPPPAAASVDWKAAETQKLLPKDLLRRLRAIESSLKQIEPRTAKVADDVRFVQEARRAAEELPTTLEDLSEKNEAIQSIHSEAKESLTIIESLLAESVQSLAGLNKDKDEAASILSKVNEAYRAATTQGLAAAFSSKAKNLHLTLIFWIIALAVSLSAGAYIAHLRFVGMDILLANKDIPTDRLWIQAVLAVLGIGGPIWFAWIATKQIGQRFRMAEDYAYKATVAKAYEGYRLEAMNVDSALAGRLFETAIQRLEEAPLRLVEKGAHGSPMDELLDSAVFRRAAEKVPELMDLATEFGRKAGRAAFPEKENP